MMVLMFYPGLVVTFAKNPIFEGSSCIWVYRSRGEVGVHIRLRAFGFARQFLVFRLQNNPSPYMNVLRRFALCWLAGLKETH